MYYVFAVFAGFFEFFQYHSRRGGGSKEFVRVFLYQFVCFRGADGHIFNIGLSIEHYIRRWNYPDIIFFGDIAGNTGDGIGHDQYIWHAAPPYLDY